MRSNPDWDSGLPQPAAEAECVAVDVDTLPTFIRVAEAELAAASHRSPR
jgi:hypothetical protein